MLSFVHDANVGAIRWLTAATPRRSGMAGILPTLPHPHFPGTCADRPKAILGAGSAGRIRAVVGFFCILVAK